MAESWPQFSTEEIAAVTQVLRSGKVNYWTGTQGGEFECDYAGYSGARHAVALSNGTVTLEVSLRALGIGPGDEVIVTPRSFFASASVIRLIGAKPVFADIDVNSQNVTAETIAPCVTANTKALIAVHLAGWPCDMRPLLDLAQQHNFAVIEDCAQAHGAKIGEQHVGTFGSFGSFSFCQDKIMTTGGEGGMLLVKDQAHFEFIRSFKDHGKNFSKMTAQPGQHGFRYVHDQFGTNYRLTEMQAVIGREQLKLLEGWIEHRNNMAQLRTVTLERIPAIRVALPDASVRHAYYKYYCFVRPEALKTDWTRDRIVAELNAAGIRAFTGSCPEIYLESAFDEMRGTLNGRLPVAKTLGETSLMFLVDPTISDERIAQDNEIVQQIMRLATR